MFIVLDSGFWVLSALIALKKHDVFAGALIKKDCYWLVHCRGGVIDRLFDEIKVSSLDGVKGKLDEEDYNIFA